MAKLVVLDPSGLFRAALVSLLRGLGFDDLVEASDLQALDRRIDEGTPPEIVLINLSRGNDAIAELMRQVQGRLPQAHVVFLAQELDLDMLAKCFAAGASGYLLENISSDALSKSLTLVSAGGKVFPPELAPLIPNLAATPAPEASGAAVMLHNSRLSEREIEILCCLTRGQSNKAIAHTLEIAEATVKVHVKRILRKIAATNRTQAALWAASRGLTISANANHRGTHAEVAPRPHTSGIAPRHAAMRHAVAIKTGSAAE